MLVYILIIISVVICAIAVYRIGYISGYKAALDWVEYNMSITEEKKHE